MPLLMTDYYDAQNADLRNKLSQQLIEENKIKLAEQMRVRDEAAKTRDILTQFANKEPDQTTPTQQAYPGQDVQDLTQAQVAPEQPQGMIPQEGLTGFGGMSTPQQGPVGLQPQGDATGLGGMQPTGWAETQPQAPAQAGHETALEKTSTLMEQAQAKVDQHKQISAELRKAGLHDQADAYDRKTIAAQKEADSTTLEHYKVAEKVLDFIGGQANGYLTAIKNPNVNPEAAWQRMKLAAQTAGIDTAELDSVPVDQRQAYAEQAKTAAYSSKEQLGLETTLLKDKTKRDIQNQIDKIRRDVLAERTSDHAKVRELGEKRFDWSKTKFATKQDWEEHKFEYTQLHEGIKTQLAQTKVTLDETDKEIKDVNTRKMELDKGNLYFDTNGHPISSSDEETRNAESKLLLEKLAVLNEKKNSLLKDVDDLGNNQTELEKSLPKFAKEGAKSDTTSEPKVTTPTKGSYTAAQTSWIDANVAGNPGMSREEVIAEGIKSGKLPAEASETNVSSVVKPKPSSVKPKKIDFVSSLSPGARQLYARPEAVKDIINQTRESGTKLSGEILKIAKQLDTESPGIFDRGITGSRNTGWLARQ